MRKWLKVFILPAVLIFCLTAGAEAVTFDSSGGSSPAVKKSGKPSAPSGGSKGVIALLDLPQGQKTRLAESVELTRLSALQADLAMKKLEELNNRDASYEEMKAHLDYAQESMEALGRAGDRLEDAVKIIRVALSGAEGKEALLAAAEELMEVFPYLGDLLKGAPAFAYDQFTTPEEVLEYEVSKISRGMKAQFDKAMNALSNGAKAVKNGAVAVGNSLKNAAGYVANKITAPVKAAHHKIGNTLGQKNWAVVMAGTKFVTAVTLAGVGLVVVISAPAVSAGAAVGAVAIYTVTNVGACVSLANDLNEIKGGHNAASEANQALSNINKATTLIGLAGGGSTGEVLVNVIGLTGDDLANAPGAVELTPEELAGYLDPKERDEFLQKYGNKTEYKAPAPTSSGGEGGNGGGGSGGCSDGCGN
ncbi:hypothetical protein MASR2M79_02410 [Aminivibrio sp.]